MSESISGGDLLSFDSINESKNTILRHKVSIMQILCSCLTEMDAKKITLDKNELKNYRPFSNPTFKRYWRKWSHLA